MGHLQDIINEALGKSVDLPRLLRICLLLAHRLDYLPLAEWARHELNGYPDDAALPVYRHLSSINQGRFAGQWSGVFQIPLSRLPEVLQDRYAGHDFRQGVAEAQALVAQSEGEKRSLRVNWPAELAIHVGMNFVHGSQCVEAWQEMSKASVVGLLDQVVTRILDFALQIEREHPHAGEIGSSANQPSESAMTQVFNMTIGSVQNMAAGSTGVTQVASSSVTTGDWNSLQQALTQQGVSQGEIAKLNDALKVDGPPQQGSIGPAVGGWLSKAAQGATSQVISKLVLDYLGLGG